MEQWRCKVLGHNNKIQPPLNLWVNDQDVDQYIAGRFAPKVDLLRLGF